MLPKAFRNRIHALFEPSLHSFIKKSIACSTLTRRLDVYGQPLKQKIRARRSRVGYAYFQCGRPIRGYQQKHETSRVKYFDFSSSILCTARHMQLNLNTTICESGNTSLSPPDRACLHDDALTSVVHRGKTVLLDFSTMLLVQGRLPWPKKPLPAFLKV